MSFGPISSSFVSFRGLLCFCFDFVNNRTEQNAFQLFYRTMSQLIYLEVAIILEHQTKIAIKYEISYLLLKFRLSFEKTAKGKCKKQQYFIKNLLNLKTSLLFPAISFNNTCKFLAGMSFINTICLEVKPVGR